MGRVILYGLILLMIIAIVVIIIIIAANTGQTVIK